MSRREPILSADKLSPKSEKEDGSELSIPQIHNQKNYVNSPKERQIKSRSMQKEKSLLLENRNKLKKKNYLILIAKKTSFQTQP